MIAAAVVHSAALGNHLVSDSWVFVQPRSFTDTFRFFWTSIIPEDGEAFWLRPLPMFLFWLENVVRPGTEWLPHLTNILLHTLNVFLVWHVVRIMGTQSDGRNDREGEISAFAACVVYGLHPLTVGSVDWVAARFDVACVTFGLGGMYYWFRWYAGGNGFGSFAAACALLVSSLLSKEQGITFFACCAFFALVGAIGRRKIGNKEILGIGIPIAAAATYFLYRLAIFSGVGGYVTARHGLSILPPVNYLVAVIYHYPNVIPDWRFTWQFAAVAVIAASLAAWAALGWMEPVEKKQRSADRRYVLAALALLGLSLLTTAPNPGLDLDEVVGHAESRFALIPVTAAAMLVGLGFRRFKSVLTVRIALACLAVWAVVSAWRTTVQVQAWESAGLAARSIIDQTLAIVPDPPEGSSIIFLDIPRNNSQYAYIYGIGLDYALRSAYRRSDLRIVRFPERDDLRHANPDRDAVIQFHKDTGQLEKLRAVKKSGKRNASPATPQAIPPIR